MNVTLITSHASLFLSATIFCSAHKSKFLVIFAFIIIFPSKFIKKNLPPNQIGHKKLIREIFSFPYHSSIHYHHTPHSHTQINSHIEQFI